MWGEATGMVWPTPDNTVGGEAVCHTEGGAECSESMELHSLS